MYIVDANALDHAVPRNCLLDNVGPAYEQSARQSYFQLPSTGKWPDDLILRAIRYRVEDAVSAATTPRQVYSRCIESFEEIKKNLESVARYLGSDKVTQAIRSVNDLRLIDSSFDLQRLALLKMVDLAYHDGRTSLSDQFTPFETGDHLADFFYEAVTTACQWASVQIPVNARLPALDALISHMNFGCAQMDVVIDVAQQILNSAPPPVRPRPN